MKALVKEHFIAEFNRLVPEWKSSLEELLNIHERKRESLKAYRTTLYAKHYSLHGLINNKETLVRFQERLSDKVLVGFSIFPKEGNYPFRRVTFIQGTTEQYELDEIEFDYEQDDGTTILTTILAYGCDSYYIKFKDMYPRKFWIHREGGSLFHEMPFDIELDIWDVDLNPETFWKSYDEADDKTRNDLLKHWLPMV